MEKINYEYYVSLEVAKLLKELGFDFECRCYYETSGKLRGKNSGNFYNYNSPLLWQNNGNTDTQLYSAPTLDVAQRWLREVKNIEIQIKYLYKGNPLDGILEYRWAICFTHPFPYKEFEANLNECQPTYEEAQVAGIKKALELILEKGE